MTVVEDMQARMDAVERLTNLFRLERMVYMVITGISLTILLASAVVLLIEKKAGTPELAGLFGSSGLITYSTGRLLFMWNQALQVLAGQPLNKL